MTDIFISYAHEDQERVRPIVKELEKKGWSVFWDRDIPPGETWETSIGKALEESPCVLVVWSRYSKDSDWVKEEAEVAKKRGGLIPVLIDDIEPPIGFGRIQAANLTDCKNNSSHQVFKQLICAIEAKISLSTPPVIAPAPNPVPVTGAHKSGYILPNQNSDQQPESKRKVSQFAIKGKQQGMIAVVAFMVAILVVVGWFMSNKQNRSSSSGGVVADVPVDAAEAPPNFVLIRGGEFIMGSPLSERDRNADEGPQHSVRLSDFYMSKYAVTVAEFRKFVAATGYRTDAEKGHSSKCWNGKNWEDKAGVNWGYSALGGKLSPSEDNHPVVHVSWNDVKDYCTWMSKTTGKTYRLPTEAEREYACRAGSTTPFNTGEDRATLQVNYEGNNTTTLTVNSFAPNAWGLYNMYGNVYEWCSDWFGEKYYEECKAKGTVENPAGPEIASNRVLRGGGWNDLPWLCRSARRTNLTPDNRGGNVGFRLVLVP